MTERPHILVVCARNKSEAERQNIFLKMTSPLTNQSFTSAP
jgi:hypothetical protein